jgi:hypothetical protein
MEVTVSLIILAAVFGGLTATFVGVKRYVSRAYRRVVATNLGRQLLNNLYSNVNARTWNDPFATDRPLSPGTHNSEDGDATIPSNGVVVGNFTYGSAGSRNTYTVTAPAGMQYRQVQEAMGYPTE